MMLNAEELKNYLITHGKKHVSGLIKKTVTYVYDIDDNTELKNIYVIIENNTVKFRTLYKTIRYNAELDIIEMLNIKMSFTGWSHIDVQNNTINKSDIFILGDPDKFISQYCNEHPDDICKLIDNLINTNDKENSNLMEEIHDLEKEINMHNNIIIQLQCLKQYLNRPDYLKDIKIGDKFKAYNGTVCELIDIDPNHKLSFKYYDKYLNEMIIMSYPDGRNCNTFINHNEFDIIEKLSI